MGLATLPVLLSILSRILDYRRARPEDTGEHIAAYLKERYRFSALMEGLSHLAFLLFWLFGGFALYGWIALGVVSGGAPELAAPSGAPGTPLGGIIFGALLMVTAELGGIPFRYYSVFSIETRYGYNRSSRKTFFLDILKGMLLSAVIATLLYLLLYSLSALPAPADWLAAWGGYNGFTILLTLLAPRLIMPLFNTFKPLPEGELKVRLESTAKKAGVKLQAIEVIDGSRRSSKANAFVAGFGKKRRLAFYDTFLERSSPGECEAVMAHELGHLALGHIRKQVIATVLITLPLFAIFFKVMDAPELFSIFGITLDTMPRVGTPRALHLPDRGMALILTALVVSLTGGWVTPLAVWFSRKREYGADSFAKQLTGSGEELSRALEKLEQGNGAHPDPHPLSVFLRYSHPPVRERKRRLSPPSTLQQASKGL